MTQEEMKMTLDAMGEKALSASRALAVLSPEVKTAFLLRMADLIESESASVIEANIKLLGQLLLCQFLLFAEFL